MTKCIKDLEIYWHIGTAATTVNPHSYSFGHKLCSDKQNNLEGFWVRVMVRRGVLGMSFSEEAPGKPWNMHWEYSPPKAHIRRHIFSQDCNITVTELRGLYFSTEKGQAKDFLISTFCVTQCL